MSNGPWKNVVRRTNNKRHALFACVAVACVLVATAVLVNSAIFQHGAELEPVIFLCRSFSDNSTFNISVLVDLKNGMDQDDAIDVATKAYEFKVVVASHYQTLYFRKETQIQNGTWIVGLDAKYMGSTAGATRTNLGGGVVSPTHSFTMVHEVFQVIVDPNAKTVELHDIHLPGEDE